MSGDRGGRSEGWSRLRTAAALAVAVGLAASGCAGAHLPASAPTAPSHADAALTHGGAVPTVARLAIASVLAAHEPQFRVQARGPGRAAAHAAGVLARFSHAGAVLRADGVTWSMPAIGSRRAAPVLDANRVTYRARGLSEWFAAGPLGLEQGFTLVRAPGGAAASRGEPGRATVISLPVGRLPVSARARLRSPRELVLMRAGRPALRYGELAARDADGRRLPAALVLRDRRLSIRVDVGHATYPVTVDPLVQTAELTTGDNLAGLGDGGVAISGNTIVAGAPDYPTNQDEGAVYVFVEPAGGWANTTSATARLTDGQGTVSLGQSVAIDGDTIVAGAHGSGYADVFVEPAGGWGTTATPDARLSDSAISGNTGLGKAVAVSGSAIAVGDPADSGLDGLIDVYVQPAGGWSGGGAPNAITTPTVRLTDSTFSSGAFIEGSLGASLAFSGATLVAGAPTWRANNTGAPQTGAALVFVKPPSGWGAGGVSQHQTAILTPAAGSFTGDPSLASAVAVDGSTIVAGAPSWVSVGGASTGAAYVYTEPAGGWASETEAGVLTPSDGVAGEQLGAAVAVSGAVIGAGAPEDGANDVGAVDVFREPAGGWHDATEDQKLTASDASTNLDLGSAVAASGATIVGAANTTQTGRLYLFSDPAPAVTTTTLPAGEVSAPYAATAAATGGTPPYVWSASGLPAGLAIDPVTGAISGTPATPGTFPVSLTVGDAYGQSANASISLTIVPAPLGTTTPTRPPAPGATPTVRSAPTVSSTAKDGQTLSCTGATFDGLGTPSVVTITWFAKVPSVIRGVFAISQVATGPTYAVPDDTPGTLIYCEVKATASDGLSVTVGSNNAVVEVSPPVLATPLMLVTHADTAPAIDASLVAGDENTCSSGVWQHHPTSYRYAWYVVSTRTAPVTGLTPVGTEQQLPIDSADDDGYLVCQVTATNSAGSTTALSNRYFIADPDLGFTIDAMEITQGIQTPELPTRDGLDTHVAYHGVPLPWSSGAPVTTLLAEGHATVIRVYVTRAEPLHGEPAPAMTLSANLNGEPLGTIYPDQLPSAPTAIPQGSFTSTVAATQRAAPGGAYTFTLPPSWTYGDVSFTATIRNLPFTLTCGNACFARRTLTLGPEHFNETTVATIDQLGLVVDHSGRPCPGAGCVAPAGFPGVDPIWTKVQALTPLPLQIQPKDVALDGTGIVDATAIHVNFPCITNCDHSVAGDATDPSRPFFAWQVSQLLPMVSDWANDNDIGSSEFPYALFAAHYATCCTRAGATSAGESYDPLTNLTGPTDYVLDGDRPPAAFSPEVSPVIEIAHEFHHGLGYKHDDSACGGQLNSNGGSENWSWPSDVAGEPAGEGDLDGIGLDTSQVSPYRIIPSPAAIPGAPQVWDLMSYCPTSGGYSDQNHWIAVRNWNRDVEFNAPVPPSASGDAAASRSAAASGRVGPPARAQSRPGTAGPQPTPLAAARSLAVSSVVQVGAPGALQLSVTPDAGAPTPSVNGEAFGLAGLDRSGQVVARAGATSTLLHFDDSSEPDLLVSGRLPVTGVNTIQVTEGGNVVTQISAARHPPRVRLLAPRARATVGGPRGVTIRWRARSDSGRPLQATVDYSPDGGGHWHTVYIGIDHGRALLPSGFLSASHAARVRIQVSDGFGSTTVTSHRFTARGAPPTVSITTPLRARRLLAGAALTLRGAAFDDAGTALRGRALVWRAGRTVIGHGAVVAPRDLPAGRHRITLSARDHLGRTSVSRPVTVTVLPAPPVVVKLQAPHRVSRTARRLTVRLALLVPAVARIGHQRFSVGRALQRLRVRIHPGDGPLVLLVRLRSGPYQATFPITVERPAHHH